MKPPSFMIKKFWRLYHFLWAYGAAVWYRFPSRKLVVIGVTGTKGKTTTVELMAHVFASAGHRVVSSSGLWFRVAGRAERNDFKMTMPGHGFLQKLMARGVHAKCDIAILEVTSEGLVQSRHRYIDFDAAVFLGIHEEHIERHGGFEQYRKAKELLFKALHESSKSRKVAIINTDDAHADAFMRYCADETWRFGFHGNPIKKNMKSLKADGVQVGVTGLQFFVNGNKIISPLLGEFNVYNILASIAAAKALGVADEVIQNALQTFPGIPGRMEVIEQNGVRAVVDYAHTPDSLEWVYKETRRIFNPRRMICILGAAGGGRDTWKRPAFGALAAMYCDVIFLTDEDPYDEDPAAIVRDIKRGIDEFNGRKVKLSASAFNVFQKETRLASPPEVRVVLERSQAIAQAISLAREGDVVVCTGKGGERWMVVADGKKIPWDESALVRKLLGI
ncbi:MAG: UDP-N-acetylmuramyl-tripeptide synthetase [Patescibacteria group bacterium]|nr:UDP-N-acetylmuramyl-tripeptide synthetase [Patescibacteria group bacterium]MDE2438463.1 UDP-N-acetylmuramyl-tripeptide synthetase [Patescibacteria group bacterium]